MNRIFLLGIAIVTLSGCTLAPRMPADVSVIPDDCANQHAIVNWLDRLAQTPQASLQSREEYDRDISAIKNRIWRIRYNCQRV